MDGTGSHGWASVALQWLHEWLLGVTITAPGGSQIRVAPDLGNLTWLNGTTFVPSGLITLQLRSVGVASVRRRS